MSAPGDCPRCQSRDLGYRDGMADAEIAAYCVSLCDDCLRTMVEDHHRAADSYETVSAPLVAQFNAVLGALGVEAVDARTAFGIEWAAILAESAALAAAAIERIAAPFRRIGVIAEAELNRREAGERD